MKQASLTLLGIPDSIQMDAQTKLFIANFGTLCIQLPGLTDAPDTTTALEIKAALFQGVWTATSFDVFCASSSGKNTEISGHSTHQSPLAASAPPPEAIPDLVQSHTAKQFQTETVVNSVALTQSNSASIDEQKQEKTSDLVVEPVITLKAEAPIAPAAPAPVAVIPAPAPAPASMYAKNVSRFPSRDISAKPAYPSPATNKPQPASVASVAQTKIGLTGAGAVDNEPTTSFKPSLHNAKADQNTAQKTAQATKPSRPQFNANLNDDKDFDIPF